METMRRTLFVHLVGTGSYISMVFMFIPANEVITAGALS